MEKYSSSQRQSRSKKVMSSTYDDEDNLDDYLIDTVVPATPFTPNSDISRNDFPDDFVFGTGTSAYQHEGGAATDGKGLSIWDAFTLSTPDRINGGSNGNVAVDMYNKYKEDIKIMKSMGFDAYRFSISWPRILPGGRPCLGVNRKGIDYYNDIINTCLENDIKPYVTLFHWDLPHCLQLEYGGFLHEDIIDDFRVYAELCFWEFGDRVKHWITLNEPWSYSIYGYCLRTFPPGKVPASTNIDSTFANFYRSSNPNSIQPLTRNNIKIDPQTDPAGDVYTVARNLLLAHAHAVQSYRTKFQAQQQGQIGITLVTHFFEAFTDDMADRKAAKRALAFMLGWFLEPVLYGKYPKSMVDNVPKSRLQKFSEEESELLKGSIDFLGLNYYTARYAQNGIDEDAEEGYFRDQKVKFLTEKEMIIHGEVVQVPIGEVAGSSWLYIVPVGIYKLLKYINRRYPDVPDIYITENGVDEKNDSKLTAYEACADTTRIKYHQDHLAYINEAINEFGGDDGNLRIKGYFAWSWCDNFEWVDGYSVRFGIMYVDYMNQLTRYPKHSATWFAEFLHKQNKDVLK